MFFLELGVESRGSAWANGYPGSVLDDMHCARPAMATRHSQPWAVRETSAAGELCRTDCTFDQPWLISLTRWRCPVQPAARIDEAD